MKFTKYDFADQVRTWSNRELINRASIAIHEAAVMANFRSYTGRADALADAIYDESLRRGNVDLYQRAFNQVAREQGHSGMISPVHTPVEQGEDLRVRPTGPGARAPGTQKQSPA